MREVATRMRDALSSRGFAGFLGALVLLGCALTALPLLRLPGYELGAALALLHGLLGGVVGVGFARRAPTSPALAAAAATATLWLALVPPFALATVGTWLGTPCDPFATSAFFPLLALPSGLLAACAGVWVGTVTRRWWTAALAWLGLVVASAAHTAWPIVFGPQVYAYNHLAGYLPGPLYDEVLQVPASLLWFRLATVALAVTFVALAARLRGRWRVVGAGGALVFLAIEVAGVPLGFRMSDTALAQELGGRWEDDALVIHYPSGLPPARVRDVVEDVRFRHRQLVDFFGAAPPGRVRVWWYASAAQKQALVGAERTQFSKPWRREVHVNDAPLPHPVLKHELAHAMAAPWGAPPFGVTAGLFGLDARMGLIEGFAVAADDPAESLTLHQWAAAMKRLALLPDVVTLLGPGGFYAAPAPRAYAAAGSFVRWLADTRGKDGLRALYRDGDFEGVYGEPLPALADAWAAFLDATPVDDAALAQALARFRGGSLFERPCAREVAKLRAFASVAPEPGRALEALARCQRLQPGEPSHVIAAARLSARQGDDAGAAKALDALLQRLDAQPALFADAALARVQVALDAGDDALARALLTRVLGGAPAPAVERTARVRLAALAMPPKARAAVDAYFSAPDDGAPLYLLRDALDALPDEPTLAYLLGRRLAGVGQSAEALRWLDVARAGDLGPALTLEATRLTLEPAWRLGDCARLDALARQATDAATAAGIADWLERCRFDASDAARTVHQAP